MNKIWSIYNNEIPEFIDEFCNSTPMQRLKDVGMNCGCEYSQLSSLYMSIREPYSRYDHSVGVALIIWHFTHSIKQSIAGLLHDISTPVFAHVIDFLNEDHIKQESTEDYTLDIIENSTEIQYLLTKYHLKTQDVCNYHIYPIADNDSPKLSADRLEYTLGGLYNYGFCEWDDIKIYYDDLIVGHNESHEEEIMFQTYSIAKDFTRRAFQTFEIYVCDIDRFLMQALADLIKYAITNKVLTLEDLYTQESHVIHILKSHQECHKLWQKYIHYSKIIISQSKPDKGYWINVNAKKRYIDACIKGKRISQIDKSICDMMEDFKNKSFDYWISAK